MREGWTLKTLNDIAKWGSGGTPKSTIKAYYGGDIPWAIIGDLNDGPITTTAKTITELGLRNSSAKIVPAESVLIAMYGSIGKLGINKIPIATNQAIAYTKTIDPQVDRDYLFYFLLFQRNHLLGLGKGGTQQNISQTVLKKVAFPYPPLPEQRAIVARLERLLGELDRSVAELEAARAKLGVWRQSVLREAFSGRLAGEELSYGVKKTELGTYISNIQAGKSFKCEERPPEEGEVGVAKVSAVTWGEYQEEESKTTHDPDRVNPKYFIQPGDFLISRANTIELVGACVIVNNVTKDVMLSDKTLRVTFQDAEPRFIMYYLQSLEGRQEIEAKSTGNQASMRNIGQARLKSILVPVFTLLQQHQIVQQIETRFSVADNLEEEIGAGLERARGLRQGVLKRAFLGELV